MAKKDFPPFHLAPLKKTVAEAVTDAAEQADLDKERMQGQEATTGLRVLGARAAKPLSACSTHDLCRQLSEEEKVSLLLQLIAELSPGQQLDWMDHLIAQLPSDALRHLDTRLHMTLEKTSGHKAG